MHRYRHDNWVELVIVVDVYIVHGVLSSKLIIIIMISKDA